MKTYDVIIATPGENFVSEYVYSLTQTIKELEKNNISWNFVYENSANIFEARRLVLERANMFNYKKIFWIDSDISWKPKDFIKIYLSDEKILSGIYLRRDGVPVSTKIENGENFSVEEIKKLKKYTRVQYTGFGFICIDKKTMNCLQHPFSSIFVKNNGIERFWSEDSSWCIRIQNETNNQVLIDPSVLVTHIKNVSLNWY